MAQDNRRHDIDALRVIAIGLLLLYHTAIGFQSWGYMVGFITNKTPLPSLWPAMALLNIWRIPILFFISGMGVFFAMQNRIWKQLLTERARRILLPFLFGCFAIVPVHVVILKHYYSQVLTYTPNPGHLWFLGNIFLYVLLLSPLFYFIKNNRDSSIVIGIRKLFSTPLGLATVIAVFMAEVVLVEPAIFEMYAMTWHGFFLGIIAFFFGFCFVLSGSAFWGMLLKWKWAFLVIALLLYGNRLMSMQMKAHHLLLVIESNCWIFAILSLAHQYLNKDTKTLRYLSQAIYPVYIIHMMVLYLTSHLLFPLEVHNWVKFPLVLLVTFGGSAFLYEFIIKRVKILRILFGLKP